MLSSQAIFKFIKVMLLLLAAQFLYTFFKNSYEELFINPVHFFEDAYMFIRYAKIWHLGYGESWNIGSGPVYGNTSQLHFLWVLILTSFQSLTDNQVIKLSSYVPAFIFMAWLPWFCSRHSLLFSAHPMYQKMALWTGLICPLVYWNTPFAYHDLTGMDTSLSVLMHLLLIDAVLTHAKHHSKTLFAAVLVTSYLAFLTRPENILTVTLFTVLYWFFITKDFSSIKKYMLCLSILLLVDGLAKYFYFGDVVPLAFYAKKSGYIHGNLGAGFSHPLFYFFYFLSTILPFIFVQFFSLRKNNLMQQMILIAPAVLTIVYFFTMMTVMNMQGRYFYPFTPYFIAAAVLGFNQHSFNPQQYVKNMVLVLVMITLFAANTIAQKHNGDIVNHLIGDLHPCDDSFKTPPAYFAGIGYRVDTDGFSHIVAVLKDTPPGVSVAMTEDGLVGSQLPFVHLIDMTGLHEPYIAKHGFSGQWLLDQKPDMIWMPHWHNTCMTREILYNDNFRAQYHFYPGLFTWGLALRKDSPYYALLSARIDEQVMSIYPGYHLGDFEKSTRNN